MVSYRGAKSYNERVADVAGAIGFGGYIIWGICAFVVFPSIALQAIWGVMTIAIIVGWFMFRSELVD